MMLAQLGFAILQDASRQFRVSGFCIDFLFFQGNGSHNLSARRSPPSVPVTLQVGVGSRCRPTRTVCDRHEAQAGIVALKSCCLVRLSTGGLGTLDEIALSSSACTQRSVCRGAAPASRLDPLTLSGDKRGRSKVFFFAVLNGSSVPDPEPVSSSCDPDKTGTTDDIPQRHPRKTSSPLASAFRLASRCNNTIARLASQMRWRTTFAILENSDALGNDCSVFASCFWESSCCLRCMDTQHCPRIGLTTVAPIGTSWRTVKIQHLVGSDSILQYHPWTCAGSSQ